MRIEHDFSGQARIYGSRSYPLLVLSKHAGDGPAVSEGAALLKRIEMCVKVCEGIEDHHLEALTTVGGFNRMTTEKLLKQREELLASLKEVTFRSNFHPEDKAVEDEALRLINEIGGLHRAMPEECKNSTDILLENRNAAMYLLEKAADCMGLGDAARAQWLANASKPLAEINDGNPQRKHHKLDTDKQVFFYEQEFYVLSNFSSFSLLFRGEQYATSEHAYHCQKFTDRCDRDGSIRRWIKDAPSAHEAYKRADLHYKDRRPGWEELRISIMHEILRAKVEQHEYVRRKLLETGDRELIEDSWRDPFWGWGQNKDGQNMLGKLWMDIRAEIRAQGA
jgi:conserved hypothetical protein, ribA/ribD-fused